MPDKRNTLCGDLYPRSGAPTSTIFANTGPWIWHIVILDGATRQQVPYISRQMLAHSTNVALFGAIATKKYRIFQAGKGCVGRIETLMARCVPASSMFSVPLERTPDECQTWWVLWMLLLLESGIKCSFFLGIFLFLMKCTTAGAVGRTQKRPTKRWTSSGVAVEGAAWHMGRVYTGWRAHVPYACVPLHESAVWVSECIYCCLSVCVCVSVRCSHQKWYAEIVCWLARWKRAPSRSKTSPPVALCCWLCLWVCACVCLTLHACWCLFCICEKCACGWWARFECQRRNFKIFHSDNFCVMEMQETKRQKERELEI